MGSFKTLGDLFDSFEHEAFRLETLNDYSNSGSTDAYQSFLAGEPQPKDYNADWVQEVREITSAGKRIYRVHIISRPLTPYLRFELGWGYQTNMTGGEEFFILDTTSGTNPLNGVGDFWLFDGRDVASMSYDQEGRFLGAEVLPPVRASEFVKHRDTALASAVPFVSWWEQYGSK